MSSKDAIPNPMTAAAPDQNNGHEADLHCAERALTDDRQSFAGAYMAVSNILYVARADAAYLKRRTLLLLIDVLRQSPHASQRQIYFLHRQAAMALTAVIAGSPSKENAGLARRMLRDAMDTAPPTARRAACEAAGSLPWRAPADDHAGTIPTVLPPRIPEVSWQQVLSDAGCAPDTRHRRCGRSLVLARQGKPLLVVKLAESRRQGLMLEREAYWMQTLQRRCLGFCERFDIPRPMDFNGAALVHVTGLPGPAPFDAPPPFAIAYQVHPDYFRYPNARRPDQRLTADQFVEVISRNAAILGRLGRMGLLHNALLPLFHNRLQQDRRDDNGHYLWQRGGRLDRWIDSCRHPNIGISGLRDFEHLEPLPASARRRYDVIGMQLFSLALLAGSWFRARSPEIRGLDPEGGPVDARHLFDAGLLESILTAVVQRFYTGFVGCSCPRLPVDLAHLARRMVEEMGRDRYMTEILRTADQHRMSEKRFRRVLVDGGIPARRAAAAVKGKQDITIVTGPHLGGFNQRISLPELTTFAASTAACCIADRHWQDSFDIPTG